MRHHLFLSKLAGPLEIAILPLARDGLDPAHRSVIDIKNSAY
jgi:hypothetical protein